MILETKHREWMTRRCLIALCAGDAVGATSEFKSMDGVQETFAKLCAKSRWPLAMAGGGAFNWRVGETTDDGDQAKALVRTIRAGDYKTFHAVTYLQNLVDWCRKGPKDIGGLTRGVLSEAGRLLKTKDLADRPYVAAYSAFQRNQTNAPNGSLSRNGVVAPAMATQDEAFAVSLKQSIVTHYHPACVIACAAQTYVQKMLMAGRWPWDADEGDWCEGFHATWTKWLSECKDADVVAWLRNVSATNQMDAAMSEFQELDLHDLASFDPFGYKFRGGGGGAFITLKIALWALWLSKHDENYDTVPWPSWVPVSVRQTRGPLTWGIPALVGRDCDTYCAAAAPMIVCAFGGKIPESMRSVEWKIGRR